MQQLCSRCLHIKADNSFQIWWCMPKIVNIWQILVVQFSSTGQKLNQCTPSCQTHKTTPYSLLQYCTWLCGRTLVFENESLKLHWKDLSVLILHPGCTNRSVKLRSSQENFIISWFHCKKNERFSNFLADTYLRISTNQVSEHNYWYEAKIGNAGCILVPAPVLEKDMRHHWGDRSCKLES